MDATFALAGVPYLGLAVLAVVGVVAGVVNTMAGGGSFLSLPALMFVGLPAGLANGSLRVAVVLQNIAAVATFHKKGVREYGIAAKLLVPAMLGSLGGSFAATRMDDDLLRPVFGGLLVVWAIILLWRPQRFLEPPDEPKPVGPLALFLAFLVGGYAGFFQGGVGFPLLALLIGYLGLDPVKANSVKMVVVLFATSVALINFAIAGQVLWIPGLALAAGTSLGGYLGAQWQTEKGAGVVRWFLVIAVSVAGVVMIASSFT